MRADLARYHSSRCVHIRHICEDAATSRPQPSIRRTPFRLAWLRGRCHPSQTSWSGSLTVRLAVSNARVALSDFYNVAIRIANVAARLAVFGLRLRDELGSSASPKFITSLNICDADIHEAAD